MENTAACLVDRVLPNVPIRQYVLSLPWELRPLTLAKPAVVTALGRIFTESVFETYLKRAGSDGIDGARCGAVSSLHRAGDSFNANPHWHNQTADGLWYRGNGRHGSSGSTALLRFEPAPPPTLRPEPPDRAGRRPPRLPHPLPATRWRHPPHHGAVGVDGPPRCPGRTPAPSAGPLLRRPLLATGPRLTWAQLLQRTYAIDLGTCPRCGGRMMPIAQIHDPAVIRRILDHLDDKPAAGHPAPRGPPMH